MDYSKAIVLIQELEPQKLTSFFIPLGQFIGTWRGVRLIPERKSNKRYQEHLEFIVKHKQFPKIN